MDVAVPTALTLMPPSLSTTAAVSMVSEVTPSTRSTSSVYDVPVQAAEQPVSVVARTNDKASNNIPTDSDLQLADSRTALPGTTSSLSASTPRKRQGPPLSREPSESSTSTPGPRPYHSEVAASMARLSELSSKSLSLTSPPTTPTPSASIPSVCMLTSVSTPPMKKTRVSTDINNDDHQQLIEKAGIEPSGTTGTSVPASAPVAAKKAKTVRRKQGGTALSIQGTASHFLPQSTISPPAPETSLPTPLSGSRTPSGSPSSSESDHDLQTSQPPATVVDNADQAGSATDITCQDEYSRFKPSEFIVVNFRRSGQKFSTAPTPVILSDLVKTVRDVLEEWRYGFGGNRALQELNSEYGTSWRDSNKDHHKYIHRSAIVQEYVRLVECGNTEAQAISILEQMKGSRELSGLYRSIKKAAIDEQGPLPGKGKRKKVATKVSAEENEIDELDDDDD
ncbi:hypothetical protein BGZ83_003521 [Gryganskiella cystojenkinii]|nr:hypothetical protein BGZ83_003521 [Gryganskiella cystojenkinii]